ncbi:MAG: HEAT repeat domain-containing protein [Acidobacteria bacterium]|nr:HEAT repeat domain-containing protein [Acidobacteriota bacterium]
MEKKTITPSLLLTLGLCLGLVLPAPLAQTAEEFIANLHSPIVKTRREAAKKLGELRQRVAVQPLIEALREDQDPEVRAAAAQSLGLIKDEVAVPALFDGLKDKVSEVRQAAIVGLVTFHIEQKVDFLTARRKGIQWLNPFLETYEGTILEPYTPVDPRVIDALVEVALRDRDQEVRIVAIRALGVLRANNAIPQLGDLMLANSFVRVEILRTFIKLGDQAAAEYIIPFLNDKDSDVRYQALTAIGLLRSDAAVPELIDVYNSSKDAKSKRLALEALALIGNSKAESIFLANLASGDTDMRRFGYEGLARMGNEEYVERVSKDRLRERHDEVQLAQAFALYSLGRQEYIEAVVQNLSTRRRQQAYGYLLEVQPEALYPYLRQPGLQSRRWIVEALGHSGSEETIGKLTPLLQSNESELVNATTLAIERIKRRGGIGEPPHHQKRPKRVGD